MREKAEMLFGHLKRISDWTPAWPHGAKDEFLLTGIAQNWGIGPTDPCTRAHLRHMRRGCSNFASPANAAGADRPLPSAGFFSATHWAWPFEVMAPQAAPLATIHPPLRRTLVADPVGIASDER
jgi:hypothetical protein